MKSNSGFSLIEVLLAVAIFGLTILGVFGAVIYGQQGVVASGNSNRAVFLAQEGIEAMRSMRDERFGSLTDGTYGIGITSGKWGVNGSSDTIDGYTRSVTVSTVNQDVKKIVSRITWQSTLQRSGVLSLTSYLTNWKEAANNPAESLVVNITNATYSSANRNLQGITLQNTGNVPIIISHMNVSWTGNRQIDDIQINGAPVWVYNGIGTPDGRQNSGTLLDIQDVTLASNSAEIPLTRIRFSGSMSSQTVDITFTLQNGEIKSITGIKP